MPEEKIEAWFVSQVRRQYLGVESTAYLSGNKFTKKIYRLMVRLTNC